MEDEMSDSTMRRWSDSEPRLLERRQLLQALGFGAAALATNVFPARLTAQVKGGKSFPVTTMNHLSYQCGPDYVKVRDWYVDLFGGRVAWDNGKQCEVQFGDPNKPEGLYIRSATGGGKPTIGHFAFGIPNITAHLADMKVEMERWGLKNIRPDGEHGWISDDPAGYMLNTWVPEKDKAMFPGAASPCKVADSKECRDAYEVGLKNLAKMPKPSGKGFTARYFTNIVLNVPTDMVAKERDFYRDLLGMKVLGENAKRVILRFGGDTLVLAGTLKPGEEPYCNHFGLQIDNFDSAKVEAELKRRGLNPKPNTKLAWTVNDPDGLIVDVAGAGFAEELAKTS
jgi:catechol 2,3-dioxygenase-like lactoylglutathione lyase family enzyme